MGPVILWTVVGAVAAVALGVSWAIVAVLILLGFAAGEVVWRVTGSCAAAWCAAIPAVWFGLPVAQSVVGVLGG